MELPTDPVARFAGLFRTRERWKAEQRYWYQAVFVRHRGGHEDLDKLLLKYARALTGKEMAHGIQREHRASKLKKEY